MFAKTSELRVARAEGWRTVAQIGVSFAWRLLSYHRPFQPRAAKELNEYSRQVELEKAKTLESQREELAGLEAELKLVIEREAATRAMLVDVQKRAQHQLLSRGKERKRRMEKKTKTLRAWETKVVSQLNKAQTAVIEAQSIQQRLKRSVSCVLCSKWTMDPVVLVPCGHLYCAECIERHKRVMRDGEEVLLCAFGDCAAKGIPSKVQVENLDISRICRLFVTKKGTERTIDSLLETLQDNVENIKELPVSRLLCEFMLRWVEVGGIEMPLQK